MQRRVALRDRVFLPVVTTVLVGPLSPPSAQALQARLAVLAQSGGDRRVFTRYDRTAGTFAPVPPGELRSFCAELVEAMPDVAMGEPAERALSVQGPALGDLPARITAGADWVALTLAHVVGDGRLQVDLLRRLVGTPADPAARQPDVPFAKHPILSSVRHVVVTHPGVLLAAGAALVHPSRRPLRATVPFESSLAAVSARTSADVLGELRRERKLDGSGPSVTAMLFARSCAAFAKAGLGGTAPRIQMIVDLRRYLPPGRTVEGNFVCGTVLHPTNAGDSVSMYRAIQESTSTARPLAALALSSVRAGVVGPRSKVAATVRSAPPEPELVFSNLGALDALDDLPWAASRGDRRVVVTGSETGPEEITISFAECFEALHVTARFHSTTFDSEAVQSAVDIMCRD